MIKIKALSIAKQAFGIRQLVPGSKIVTEKDQRLIWTNEITPSPLGESYTVKLIYELWDVPKAYVTKPLPLSKATAKTELPHCYDQKKQRLCLYYPDGKEWNKTLLLAKTVIPWIYDWLFHYEIWVATGDWTGGGVHLPTKMNRKKK